MTNTMRYGIFATIIIIALAIGGHIAGHIFFGMMVFIGLVGLVESIRPLKWLFTHTSALFDVVIFGASIFATVKLGVTITGAITFASIAFTFLYRPFLIKRYQARKNHKK